MGKELREIRKTVYKQNENLNKEVEIIKKRTAEILDLKNTITELKRITRRIHQTQVGRRKNQQTSRQI